MDQGLPTCSRNGGAATDGGAEKFISIRCNPTTGDILGELLQLEEGKGKVRDYSAREERHVRAS
jgi:hypothetical protein